MLSSQDGQCTNYHLPGAGRPKDRARVTTAGAGRYTLVPGVSDDAFAARGSTARGGVEHGKGIKGWVRFCSGKLGLPPPSLQPAAGGAVQPGMQFLFPNGAALHHRWPPRPARVGLLSRRPFGHCQPGRRDRSSPEDDPSPLPRSVEP